MAKRYEPDDDLPSKLTLSIWWFWGAGLLILTGIVLTVLGYAGKLTSTAVEREVFEQSYQVTAATKQEIATTEAELAATEQALADPALTKETRHRLRAQAAALRVRLQAARARQR